MFSIVGGHWAVLQTIAWANMIRTYSQDASLQVAIEKTFDGEHPCSMCMTVSEGRAKEEKAPATVKVEKKAEVFVLAVTATLQKPDSKDFSYPRLVFRKFVGRSDVPPSPVPRSFIS
ncbi:MAG: hypothetical protein ABI615_08215 [Chthoniobacterales bacterium]